MLPAALSISSVAQLVNVGKLLRAKLDILGFGNELAQQIVRLHDAYKQIGLDVPDDLLELMSVESMIDLLENISKALRDVTKLVRITGTYGLGQVLGLVMTMFPQDTLVTVNGLVILEGSRNAIMIDFGTRSKSGGVSQFALGTRVNGAAQPLQCIKIEINPQMDFPAYSYTWMNWVKDHLQLMFLTFGVTCPTKLLKACSEILIAIARILESDSDLAKTETALPVGPLLDPMDHCHFQKMSECCQTVLGVTPSGSQLDLQITYSDLMAEASDALAFVTCSCTIACDMSNGWDLNPRKKSTSAENTDSGMRSD